MVLTGGRAESLRALKPGCTALNPGFHIKAQLLLGKSLTFQQLFPQLQNEFNSSTLWDSGEAK